MHRQCLTVTQRNGEGKWDLIKIIFEWGLLMIRQIVVRELMFPGDAWPRAAGLSDLFDSFLLELRQLLWIEARPVEGADASGSPVIAEAVDTFDDLGFGVVLGDGRVGT